MQTLNHGTISVTVKRVSIHAEVKLVIIQSISTSKLQSTTMSLHDKMHSWTFYSIIKGQTYPTPPYPTSLIPHTLYLTHPIYPTPFQFPSAQSNNVSKNCLFRFSIHTSVSVLSTGYFLEIMECLYQN